MKTPRAYRWFAVAAYLTGLAGQGALFARILLSGLELWPEAELLPGVWPWLINTGWLFLFGVQHSGMARAGFKHWLTRWFPTELERSLYVGVSGLVTLGLALTWQPVPGEAIWCGPPWLAGISVFAALAAVALTLAYDHLSFFGLRQAWGGQETSQLNVTGPYRYVRHPLMLSMLLFLWAQPTMTPTLAMLSGGMTIYILLALPLEERALVREFGPAYEDYRRHVPALIPWIWLSRRRDPR